MTLYRWGELDRGAVTSRLQQGAATMLAWGAVEQHGPHLPTGTDTLLASLIVDRVAAAALRDVLVLPPISFGLSGYHRQWGATVAVSAETLTHLLCEVAQSVSAAGGRDLIIINGHGGNRGICTTVSLAVSTAAFSVQALCYWDVATELARTLYAHDSGSLGHAGQAETGLVAAFFPELMGATTQVPSEPIGPALGSTAIMRLGQTGVSGDPAAGTAEQGRAFADEVVDRLAALVDGTRGRPGQAV